MKTVIEMAREVESEVGFQWCVNFIELERFAALVIANIDPSSWMSFQEGLEAGRLAEREACAKVCDWMAQRTQDIRSAALESAAQNIRARGNT
mgnify:CR=1 FL=1